MADQDLDVRPLPKPDKHPAIFRAYDALAVGESFVLVNNHDPRHLREEFEAELPGSYGWDYLASERGEWRIRITKLASTPLPRILCDAPAAIVGADPASAGAVWKLQMRERDLDSNIIRLQPDDTISEHAGPGIDVLMVVLDGSGQLNTELGTVALRAGAVVWLPRRSRRQFTAGADGLAYLTVHQRRQSLVVEAAPRSAQGGDRLSAR